MLMCFPVVGFHFNKMIATRYGMPRSLHCRCPCILQYRRRLSSTVDSTPSEPMGLEERKSLILWQLKLSAYFAGAVMSVYGAYVVISSGFHVERIRRKFTVHWNGLFYGTIPPPNICALLNSRFNVCLSPDMLHFISSYFIKFDLLKDNGVRRRDIVLFLESVAIGADNAFVDRFISRGAGDTKDHRLISGCSLQEFAELLEVLVLEDRLNGEGTLESKLMEKLREFTGEEEASNIVTYRGFRLSNPLLSGAVKSLSNQLSQYIERDIKEAEASDLQNELERNYKLRAKLEQLASSRKLSEPESRRLTAINREIALLEGEVSKQNHTSNVLWLA